MTAVANSGLAMGVGVIAGGATGVAVVTPPAACVARAMVVANNGLAGAAASVADADVAGVGVVTSTGVSTAGVAIGVSADGSITTASFSAI